MKNLKRTLCLVLAVAMCLGFAAMASAAFTDADEINYPEAVDLLSSIGVINGFPEDNTFRPQGTLTRAQACKIITYLLGADDITATSTFDDCQGHWAEANIAYCAAQGIVNGVGDNKFDPNGTLTGYAFAKMVLCALGYNADVEGMTGESWQIGVAKLIKATKLSDGIKGFDGTADLPREQACQIAFNALFTEEVAYASGGTTITTSDGTTITTGASAAAGTGEYLATDFNIAETTDVADPDAYGRAAVKQWSVDDKVVFTEYEEADWTYTNLTGEYVDEATIIAAYAKEAGVKAADVTLSDYHTCPGAVSEYTVSKDKKTLTMIASWEHYPYQVTNITDTADTDADYKKDIELDSGAVIHETDLTVEVKKGDWLAIPEAYSGDDIYADAVVMEGVNGVMSKFNGTKGTATIGGTALVLDDDLEDVDSAVYGKDFASTLTYYTSPLGLVLVAEVYEEAFEYTTQIGYALYEQSRAYAGGSASDLLGGGGSEAKDGRAVLQILGMDGSVTTYDLAVKQDTKNEKTEFIGKDSYYTGDVADKAKTDVKKFVEFYVNDDGTIVVTNLVDVTSITTAKADYNVAGQKANSNTVIHIVHAISGGKYATETITGYKNFVAATYDDAYMVVEKGYITDIYAVNVPTTPVVVAPTLGYCKTIGDETAAGTEVTFVVDGKDVTYIIEDISAIPVEAKKYYEVKVSSGKVTAATEATPDYNDAVISTVDSGYVDTDQGVIEFLKNTNTYDISGKSLSLAKGVKIDVFNLTTSDQVIFIVGK